jgi:hypothetical protein
MSTPRNRRLHRVFSSDAAASRQTAAIMSSPP